MRTLQLISTLRKVPFFTKQNLGVALGKEGEDPRWERLYKALSVDTQEEVIQQLVEKIKQLDPGDVRRDLEPFIPISQIVTSFSEHFGNILFTGAESLAGK